MRSGKVIDQDVTPGIDGKVTEHRHIDQVIGRCWIAKIKRFVPRRIIFDTEITVDRIICGITEIVYISAERASRVVRNDQIVVRQLSSTDTDIVQIIVLNRTSAASDKAGERSTGERIRTDHEFSLPCHRTEIIAGRRTDIENSSGIDCQRTDLFIICIN